MLELLLVGLVLLALLWLPILLLKVVFKLVFGLVFLPFKLLGAVFHIAFGVVGGLFRVLFSGLGIVALLVAIVGAIILLPLLPLLLIGGVIWLLTRPPRRAALRPIA